MMPRIYVASILCRFERKPYISYKKANTFLYTGCKKSHLLYTFVHNNILSINNIKTEEL